MERALHELPLALFTTLASVGAGAFIYLSLAGILLCAALPQIQRKADILGLIPAGIVGIGFIASVFHLANPFHGIYVFAHLGTSPLSNELLAASAFAGAMAIYVVLGLFSKLASRLRMILNLVLIVLAIVFVASMGFAYMMPTIVTWNTAYMVAAMLGYCFVGGSALAGTVLCIAGHLKRDSSTDSEQYKKQKKLFVVLALFLIVVGFVLAFVGTFGQYQLVQDIKTGFVVGAHYAHEVRYAFYAFVALFTLGAILSLLAYFKPCPWGFGFASVVLILAVFSARLVFYATEISVGVQMLRRETLLQDESLEAIHFIAQVLGSLLCCDPKLDPEVASLYSSLNNLDPETLVNEWPYIEVEDKERARAALNSMCSVELNDQLTDEYRRLFVGPGHLALAPYGSVYTDHEGVMYGKTTLDFRDFLRRAGVHIKLAQPVPEDHVGYQLLVLAELCATRPEYVPECLERHILPWAPYYFSLLEQTAQHSFFEAIAVIAHINLRSIKLCENLSVEIVILYPPRM